MINCSKTFCVSPWIHLSIDCFGNFSPCCKSEKNDGIKDSMGNFFNIRDNHIEEVWNSDFYKKIRLQFLRGEKPKSCKACFEEEKTGISSLRIGRNRFWHRDISYVEKITRKDGSAIPNIKFLRLMLGTACNCSCRMCGFLYSNPEKNKKGSKKKDYWFNKPKCWKKIFSIIKRKELKKINIIGGEPTIIPEHYQILKKCIELKLASKITLEYNINMTKLPTKLIQYWKKFKEVKVNCSIDGYGKLNEYIRYPSLWKNVDKNFKKLNLLSKNNNIKVDVTTTIQLYNILKLTNLFDYLKKFNIFPYLNLLSRPNYFNIRVLNKKQKQKVAEKINIWIQKNKNYFFNNKKFQRLPGLIKHMESKNNHYLYPKFLKITKEFDKKRKQELKKYCPELLDL